MILSEAKQKKFEIGIYTLGDISPDLHTGKIKSMKERMDEVIAAGELADEAGLDLFGVGEHHRLDFTISSPAMVLSAVAQATKQIKLTSTTSVLSTLDPVRLYEDFATLDLISNGRAELIAGRGAFTESFPLFGYSLNDYDHLFSEHMDLLIKLNKNKIVSWNGNYRSSFKDGEISPRPVQDKLPIWIGVGGTLETAARAGDLGVGMAMAILKGNPEDFKPLTEKYLSSGLKAGFTPEQLKIAVTGHTYLAKTVEEARDEFYPYYANYKNYNNQNRGINKTLSREDFEKLAHPNSALFVGSPELIIEKILHQHELFGHTRFLAQIDIGGLPFSKIEQNIDLLATEVMPQLNAALNRKI